MTTYNRAKEFAKSIAAGEVVVKHQDESGVGDINPDDVPF
jgi:hypothetical protein